MIADYLKKYCEKYEISQHDIARKTGISQSKISQTFNHQRKLTADELMTIAIAYNIDLNKIKEIISSHQT